jgi:hypothetical protein
MRRLSTILFTVLTLAAAAACTSSPTAPVNSTFTLAPGESQTVGTISVKLVGVTEDTRCPINAMCIQVGDAYVALEVSAPGTRRELELQLLNPTNRSTQLRGYTIQVEEVTPYPYTIEPPRPRDYRVTLSVHKD